MLKQTKNNAFLSIFRLYTSVAATAIKPQTVAAPAKKQKPLISCKRTQFNLYVPAPVDSEFGTIPLAASGWKHYKSKDDFMIFNATLSKAAIQAEMQNIAEFLSTNNISLNEKLLENLKNDFNINAFTNIQTKAIPKVYDSHHVLIAAETGCGKTLAYMLPILQQVIERKQAWNSTQPEKSKRKFNTPLAIIITPGRELAAQIGTVAEKLCQQTDVQIKTILGGNTKRLMVNPEFADVDVIVATVGALSKLVTTGIYRMEEVRHVVLDEADTLLDDSFSDKLGYFLRRFPFHKNHTQDEHTVGTQLILASATMPTNTEEILQKVIDVQTLHEVASPNLHKLMPHVEQRFMRISKQSRPSNLLNLVKKDIAKKQPVIVFSNRSATSDFVDIFLNNNGVRSVNLNGDMLMKIRIGRFEQFQDGKYDVLSTTDIGSRGLDTTSARHVINFDFPLHVSDYIHRCGRIGRVGNLTQSLVTNFISSRREVEVVQKIEHAARTGGLLPNVNANIKNIINKRILKDMQAAGIATPEEEAF
ncbi:probable ATP-dependent RNA helicase DDX28 [Zeugodacus cucurbitae]|uniref:probable ATP-dependent RNA helicase DDX28 n=1 Tax=Zeugodacus cucurbitae TaxID=28588 RepID=UPI0005969D15|nr:probable ATP-dependent RNA helicase DDX28 [Zeugodacus cucurbitae]